MEKNTKIYRAAIITILLVAGGLFIGSAMYVKYEYFPEEKQIKANKKQKRDYDLELFSLFERACKTLNPDSGVVKFSGVIEISYKSDTGTLSKPELLPFLYTSKGDDFYYLLGQTETINTGGLCVYIDKEIKKVMLSNGIPADQHQGMMGLEKLRENFLSENYEMNTDIQGNIQTITFINEQHVSCKEYSLSFDKRSLQPTRLRMRLSNTKELFHENAQQWLDIHFRGDREEIDTEALLSRRVVEKAGDGYRLDSTYKGYELLLM